MAQTYLSCFASLFWAAAPSVYTPLGLSTPVSECVRLRARGTMCNECYNKLIWWQCVSAIDPRVPHLAGTHVRPAVTAVQSGDHRGHQTHECNPSVHARGGSSKWRRTKRWIPQPRRAFTYFYLAQVLLTAEREITRDTKSVGLQDGSESQMRRPWHPSNYKSHITSPSLFSPGSCWWWENITVTLE